jgi:hypothetical protein
VNVAPVASNLYRDRMNESLCATLLTVYPVILLTTVVETRAVRRKYRKTNWYTWPVGAGSMASLACMVQMAIGATTGGVTGGWAVFAWVGFGVGMASLTTVTLLLAKTYDYEDGRGTPVRR